MYVCVCGGARRWGVSSGRQPVATRSKTRKKTIIILPSANQVSHADNFGPKNIYGEENKGLGWAEGRGEGFLADLHCRDIRKHQLQSIQGELVSLI